MNKLGPCAKRDQRPISDIIVRMLFYCEEPRFRSQVICYCGIDGQTFADVSKHCIKRGTLKLIRAEEYVTTERGREVLETTYTITKVLGLSSDHDALL